MLITTPATPFNKPPSRWLFLFLGDQMEIEIGYDDVCGFIWRCGLMFLLIYRLPEILDFIAALLK